MTENDEIHLRRAIALAQTARDEGEQPYGSLLVGPSGAVLSEAYNHPGILGRSRAGPA
jgi:tRNA(Arg) A34 adenosine deaminase TadA